jgi:hypothetical protein
LSDMRASESPAKQSPLQAQNGKWKVARRVSTHPERFSKPLLLRFPLRDKPGLSRTESEAKGIWNEGGGFRWGDARTQREIVIARFRVRAAAEL